MLGLIALAVALYYSPDRRRQRLANRLPQGADTTLVLRTLGRTPTRCPAGALEHLRPELDRLEVAEADSVMGQLKRDTRQRWLYPGRGGCTPAKGEAELGIDGKGRMLWIRPAAGKTELRLSPWISY